jgi:hypothetical protein
MFFVKESSHNSSKPVYMNIRNQYTLNELGFQDIENISLFVPDKDSARTIFESKIPEKELIKFCEEKIVNKEKIFVDISSDIGLFPSYLGSFTKHVYAFESDPKKFAYLNANTLLNNITSKVSCFPFVISDETNVESSTFHYKLDDLNFIKSSEDIGFIRINNENAYKIIKGMKETLEHNDFPPILFNSSESDLMKRKELFSLFESYNYKIVKINEITTKFFAVRNE